MTTSPMQAVEADVRDALVASGLRPRKLALVSPLGERKGMRYAYRVECDDGRTIKARRFGSVEEAQRNQSLRAGIPENFAPVIERRDAVLIEEWIDGEMLDDVEAEAWAATAGGVLGSMHSTPLVPTPPPRASTEKWTDAATADLELLQQSRVLSPAEREATARALARHDPGTTRPALIHKDFCAENMLVDRSGRLRIIDTEQPAIEPAGFDLAWTWHRWPMPALSWTRFLDAYRAAAQAPVEAETYWRIVTGLTLTRVFFQRMPERLERQRVRLLQCVENAAEQAP